MSVVRTLIGNVKGPKGDTGSQGPQGVAGTIEIGSVQTVSYGSPASVTNSGTEEEAILDFQIPQGAPGEHVTDMRNLVLGAITDSTADYPAFAVNETGSTIFGKIRKFLSDLKNNYVSKAMMTTSTDVDTAGQAVADAKAIKSLNDSLSNTASDLADFETAVAANYATKTELVNQVDELKVAGRTVNFATAINGTLAITEATFYGRFTMFPFSFTANTSIASYTNLATINGAQYRPSADTNLYIVGGLAGQSKLMTLQVLKNGNIRCNQALSSGQTISCELFWISSLYD